MKLKSMRFKITVLFTAVLGLILLVYSSILYFNLSYTIYHDMDSNLREKAQEIENTLDTYAQMLDRDQEKIPLALHRTLHLQEVEATEKLQWPRVKAQDRLWEHNMQALGIKSDFVVVYDQGGNLVDTSGNMDEEELKQLQKSMEPVSLGGLRINNLIAKDLRLRVISWPYYRQDKIHYVIQLATSLKPVTFVLRNKLRLIIITLPMVLLITSFLGRFFVLKIFKPIADITHTVETISHKDMSKRVTQAQEDEEIATLVNAFNDMVSRLETSFRYIEEFSSEVAHELKTPLAIIRGESEIALKKERSSEEYKRAIHVILEEIQRMLKTIDDLLLLTKLDYRPDMFKFENIDFVEFFKEIYEQARIIASQKEINVSINMPKGSILLRASPLHLRRLFFNLIDNAIKFTPSQGKISLILKPGAGSVTVFISDTGIGIRKEDLPHVFNRFFSIDRRGAAPESATGLGLSIVQSIAKMHNGSVEASSRLGKGTTFIVRLPTL